MTQVFFLILREDQDVIQIYNHKAVFRQDKDGIHQSLKCSQDIREAKSHYRELKVIELAVES
jgi:hypothetical protein